MCSTLGLSMCGEAFPSSNPPRLQASAMRTEPRLPSLPEVCIPGTIAYGIPYRTRRSIRNSEIAYGIFAEWFCCGNPRSRIAYGILIDDAIAIRNRFGNSYRDTDSIRNWQSPPKNHCGKQSGRLPEPNLPSFLGDILPFPNTKKNDEANAKPPHFRLTAANGQPSTLKGRFGHIPAATIPPFAKTKPHNSVHRKATNHAPMSAHPEEDVHLSWSPCHQVCLRQRMLAETFAAGGKQGARTSLQRKIQALSPRERLSPAKTQSHTHETMSRDCPCPLNHG